MRERVPLDHLADPPRVADAAQLRRVHQEHRELVAAEARDDREVPRVLDQEPRDLPQRFVARAVAEAIVDVLEVVEVEEDERDRLGEARVTLPLLLDAHHEVSAIVDVGERVLERQVLEARVADRHGRLGGQGAHEHLVLRVEGHDPVVGVEGVEELEDPEDVAARVLERHDEHRPCPVVAAGVEHRIEAVGAVLGNRVGVGDVHDLAHDRDVPGEAQVGDVERLGLQPALHLGLAELPRQPVVLDDREAELVVLAQEQGAGLCTREAAGLGENALEERREVPLVAERDPDLDELPERLGEVDGERHTRGYDHLRCLSSCGQTLHMGPNGRAIGMPRFSVCVGRVDLCKIKKIQYVRG